MKVGIPKGLLYHKYHPFFKRFFYELGAEVITSPDTNREILDNGVRYCIDEACLPIKVFHGHVAELRDKCDIMVIPRIMQVRKREFICPKFCGLPEMIVNSIENLPKVTMAPIVATTKEKLYDWAKETGRMITSDRSKIKTAFERALEEQEKFKTGIQNENFNMKVALAGHPYNIYDNFINMNLVKKLNKLGVGVVTEESLSEELIDREVDLLYKRPFWTFARNTYGFATYAGKNNTVNGIIYISSFACGLDSVIIELIKDKIEDFPFMVLKVDEHTGEAGLDTRIEAFVDMLERSYTVESYDTTYGQRISGN